MDRHEYEINQLINPKKDIVKSNSKHRDKIETLIQGRRIGGITRGGDTPEKTHYKVATTSANRFAAGDIKDETFVFYGSGSDIWLMDESGIIESLSSGTEGFVNYVLLPKIQQAGYRVDKYEINEDRNYIVGYQIQNFDKFELIP